MHLIQKLHLPNTTKFSDYLYIKNITAILCPSDIIMQVAHLLYRNINKEIKLDLYDGYQVIKVSLKTIKVVSSSKNAITQP